MTRQVDSLSVYLIIRRNADGTYTNDLQNLEASLTDPNPASGSSLDKGPFVLSGVNGMTYNGKSTLDDFLAVALKSVASRGGTTLFTDRVLNRTTLQYLIGVDGKSYDTKDWIINPDLSAVKGVLQKYWKANADDTVTEMSQDEKDEVDSAALPASIAAKIAKLKYAVTVYISKHYDAAQQVTVLALWSEAISKELANRAAKIQKVMDWVNTVLTFFYQTTDKMAAATTQSDLDNITYDLSQFDAADPKVSVGGIQSTND